MINLKRLCSSKIDSESGVLERTIQLAVEIAREGREGRKIGTLFVIADEKEVLKRSRSFILDPLFGHADEKRKLCSPDMCETIKELAQLDGAFIVSGNGVVVSTARYINASSRRIEMPLGLGSRHIAAASISRDTRAIAVVVSESCIVRIFNEGRLIAEIIPEVWLLTQHNTKIKDPRHKQTIGDLAIIAENGEPDRTEREAFNKAISTLRVNTEEAMRGLGVGNFGG